MQGYTKIDQYIHQHCQTISKFGRSFGQPKEDDSHTNLSLDQLGKTVWGRWAKIKDKEYMLGLELPSQSFKLVDKNKAVLASFETKVKTQAEVEQTIAAYLKDNLSLDGADFMKPLHYEIPLYEFVPEPIPKYHVDQLDLWLQYRSQAKQACLMLTDHLQTPAEIRIWPHHFDTGVYMAYDAQVGVGFGWAMADSMIPEAYFYYSIYGLNDFKVNYGNPNKLSVGKWITGENWNGGVLPISEATPDKVSTFITETTKWMLVK